MSGQTPGFPARGPFHPPFLQGLESVPDRSLLHRYPVQRALQDRLQRIIQVTPTDVDPVAGPRHSTFNGPRFALVLGSLAGTGFAGSLAGQPGTVRGRLTYAHLNGALAAQADIPSLAAAIIAALSVGFPGSQLALTAHVGDLELALGTHAHTDAGAGDIANFRTLSGAGGVVLSRSKGTPNTMTQAALGGASGATDTALNHLIALLTARNNQLNDVTYYWGGASSPRSRANFGLAGIRSGHEGAAGWLPPSVAVPLDATLLAAVAPAGALLQGEAKARRVAIGGALVAAAGAAAEASDVEDTVNASGDAGLQNYFYRSVFWPNVPTKAERVRLAWARYGTDSSNIANLAYIEFGGGGAASRFVWDYVNDRFYLSAHYNWVDGYNPFFEIQGTAATY